MIFANSLTEPGATSLGGASFMTIYLKETGEYICIEAMETAPAAAGIDTLDEINEKKGGHAGHRPWTGPRRPDRPGEVWHHDPGGGAGPLSSSWRRRASMSTSALRSGPRPASTNWCRTRRRPRYLPTKACPMRWGTTSPTPDYADTLRKIAEGGIDEFYRGASPRPSWTRYSAWAACSPWRIWPATPAWAGAHQHHLSRL